MLCRIPSRVHLCYCARNEQHDRGGTERQTPLKYQHFYHGSLKTNPSRQAQMRKNSSCNVHTNYKICIFQMFPYNTDFFFSSFCHYVKLLALASVGSVNNNPNIVLLVAHLPGCMEAELCSRTFPWTDLAETGPHYIENVFWFDFRCPCCSASSVGDFQSLQKLPVKNQEDSVPWLKSYAEVGPTCRTQRANLRPPPRRTSLAGPVWENSRWPTVTPVFTVASTEKKWI